MSVKSDETEVDESWKVDLEIALLEDADIFRIQEICRNRPLPNNLRSDVWRVCLHLDLQSNTLGEFDDVPKLENQDELHIECEKASLEILNRITKDRYVNPISSLSNISLDSDDDVDKLELDMVNSLKDSFLPSATNITNDLEHVLTHFAGTYALKYELDNGWISILKVLFYVCKPTDRHELYGIFVSFYHRFIATGSNINQCLCSVFRVLLQYHEPRLCSYLESIKLGPETYIMSWLCNVFVDVISADVLPSLWDVYILKSDPFLGLLIALVLLVNGKSILLNDNPNKVHQNDIEGKAENTNKYYNVDIDHIRSLLLDLPKPLQCNDLISLIELTETFARTTPISFRIQCSQILFGNVDLESKQNLISNPLCMSIQIHDVLEAQALYLKDYGLSLSSPNYNANAIMNSLSELRYLLVDCRPAEQYNAGHLPSAFFLDSSLILSEPEQFQQSVKFLLSTQERSLAAGSFAAGKHITFLSSGQCQEDQLANMAIAEFLRLHIPYISLIEGGYMALHDAFGPSEIGRLLVGHNPMLCLCCLTQETTKWSISHSPLSEEVHAFVDLKSKSILPEGTLIRGLLSKFSKVMFKSSSDFEPSKSSKPNSAHSMVIGKKTAIGKNIPTTPSSLRPPHAPSSSGSNRQIDISKPVSYRNTSSVFRIDDNFDDNDSDVEEDDANTYGFGHDKDGGTSIPNPKCAAIDDANDIDGKKQPQSWFQRLTTSLPKSIPNKLVGDFPVRQGGLDCCEQGDWIDTTQWSLRPDVRGVFGCNFFTNKMELGPSGFLVLSERHLIVLQNSAPRLSALFLNSVNSKLQSLLFRNPNQDPPLTPNSANYVQSDQNKHAIVIRSVPLSIIVRITSNRYCPECITFHYAVGDVSDLLKINAQALGVKDKFYISKAGEAVKMVKLAVFNALNSMDD